MELIAYKG